MIVDQDSTKVKNNSVTLAGVSIGLSSGDEKPDIGLYHDLGLQVNLEGIVTLNGQVYKGVGVNYFDAFYRNIKDSSDESYKEGFRQLKENNIPYVRFMAGGYWPSDWSLYLNNKEEYFKRLDRFVNSAEDSGLGLIPSLFWTHHTFPDIVKESVNQWGNSNSKTIEFMKTYIEEVVTRYTSSPAIWGWEFGNEYNLMIDLPGLLGLPPTKVPLGCPAFRTAADKLSSTDLTIAINEFSNTIRMFDASRMIFSGNSIPRPSAYHLKMDQTWEVDSISQYNIALENQNPALLNSYTIHLYPHHKENSSRFADSPGASINDIIRISMEYSEKKKKPLFIGEFGAPLTIGTKERPLFMEVLEGIEMYKVPLSCVWVFDFPWQNSDWNITTTNSRKYMLEEIAKLNDRLNSPPVLIRLSDVSVNEDESYSDTLRATDEEGDAITYSAASDTSAVTAFVSDSILTLTPTANWNGVANIKAYASDGTSKDSTSFILTVTSVNDAPTSFEWVSSASDTIYITQSNLADIYTLQWDASTDIDGDSINYLIYAKIGLYPTEEVEEITDTAFQLVYEEILEQVFDGSSVNGSTVRLNVRATDGIDTVDVIGDNRVLYVNRYDYLSVEGVGIPTEFALHGNYPNPFNPTTTLRFDLPEVRNINLTIYNMLGQKIRTYDMQSTPAGHHSLKWNATNDFGDPVGAGVYLYQLQTKDFVKTRKMVLLK